MMVEIVKRTNEHNDIKADNIIVCPCLKPKIIDFGKATLKTEPVVYNLSKEETEKYNCYHRHLAYEFRNILPSKQSENWLYNETCYSMRTAIQ